MNGLHCVSPLNPCTSAVSPAAPRTPRIGVVPASRCFRSQATATVAGAYWSDCHPPPPPLETSPLWRCSFQGIGSEGVEPVLRARASTTGPANSSTWGTSIAIPLLLSTTTASNQAAMAPGALSLHADVAHAAPPADVAAGGSEGDPCPGDTLQRAAVKVLRTADPFLKAQRGELAAGLWRAGAIRHVCRADVDMEDAADHDDVESPPAELAPRDEYDVVPDEPSRDPQIQCVAPKDMPKRGRGGSLQSRRALVHSLVHIENCAIDLSWDIIARFCEGQRMPRAFYDDFVRVAEDEGRHFRLLALRLEALGSHYGALPVHLGLWETAAATSGSLLARLALEHCVHEARGLDVVPQTIARFRSGGDDETARLLETVIYPEEITHCAAGVRWFTYICHRDGMCGPEAPAEVGSSSGCLRPAEAADGEEGGHTDGGHTDGTLQAGREREGGIERVQARHGHTEGAQEAQWEWERIQALRSHPAVVSKFHELVREHFRGVLKPPFNVEAREKAGFAEDWYLPLAER